MLCNVWNGITDPFPNFNGATSQIDKQFHPTLYWAYDYLSMLGLKLIHVDKRVQGLFIIWLASSANSAGEELF